MTNAPFTSEEYARRVVRTVQIIVASLALGLIIFAGIAMPLRMNQQKQPPQPHDDFVAYCAVGFAVVCLAMKRIIGSSTVAHFRNNIAMRSCIEPRHRGIPLPAATDGDRL